MDSETKNKLARLLLNLSNTIIQNRNRHLQALGLTASQADCLQYFLANEGTSISDLKNAMDITHQTAWGIVQRMEAHGWVRLQRSDEDRRRQVVIPTASGRRLGYGTCAVNPALIPYGTLLYIESTNGQFVYGYAIAADTGGALMSGSGLVDLYYESFSEALLNAVQQVNVYVVG